MTKTYFVMADAFVYIDADSPEDAEWKAESLSNDEWDIQNPSSSEKPEGEESMTPSIPITAWAIKAPDGRFTFVSLFEPACDKTLARIIVAGGEGYSCVRVKVEEMK